MRMPQWFCQAIAYEIYPQSFLDTNGDGIGDLRGVMDKLDYVRSLGCDTIWLNPCFDSPMQDAGYDVRDYRKVAPRYGANEDLEELFRQAHARGMHILLDLVPGHTSDQHPWFRLSQQPERNAYSDRYVWTGNAFDKPREYNWICGTTQRNGCALINFFDMQPALNYGFGRVTQPWQMDWRDSRCQATMEEIIDVMRFWLRKGCDGFRVDMADSLVKDDPGKEATSALWRKAQAMLAEEFPQAVLVAEWSDPENALCKAQFQGDFYLNHDTLRGGGYRTLMRDGLRSYFHKEARGELNRFLNEYIHRYLLSRESGFICLVTSNHDTRRPALELDPSELKMAYSLLFTLPGVPFVYAGDEIGMRHLFLPSKEGGYDRTGDRTPLQWDHTPQYGFSSNPDTYLPQDMAPDAPTVADQEAEEGSLLRYVRALLTFRRNTSELRADAPFEALWQGEGGYPFVYRRGGLLLALNAAAEAREIPFPVRDALFQAGEAEPAGEATRLGGQSFVIWRA